MHDDITITETIEGFARPYAKVLAVHDGEAFGCPQEVRVFIQGPRGRDFGVFHGSKVSLVNFAKEIITAYEEK
jgi:hypothetical protein